MSSPAVRPVGEILTQFPVRVVEVQTNAMIMVKIFIGGCPLLKIFIGGYPLLYRVM